MVTCSFEFTLRGDLAGKPEAIHFDGTSPMLRLALAEIASFLSRSIYCPKAAPAAVQCRIISTTVASGQDTFTNSGETFHVLRQAAARVRLESTPPFSPTPPTYALRTTK